MAEIIAGVAMSHSPMIMTSEACVLGKKDNDFFKQQRK